MSVILRRPVGAAAKTVWLVSGVLTPFVVQAAPAPRNIAVLPASAKVDANARKKLDSMAAAYQGLRSYSGTVEVNGVGVPNFPSRRSTIVFKKPNQAVVVTTDSAGVTQTVTNGTHLFAASTREKTRYLKAPLPPNAQPIPLAIGEGGAAGLGLMPLLVAGADPLAPLAKTLRSLAPGPPNTLAGVPVDTIIAVVNGSRGDTAKITYAIGKSDHLLRRMNITQTVNGKPISLTENHANIKANPALSASALAFTPPPGAQAVASFAPPPYDPRLVVGAAPLAIDNVSDLENKPLRLDQYRGKVVLLDFWATWCGPCVAEMPNIVAAYNKYKGQGFDIIGVSLDEDRAVFSAFIKNHKLSWRQVFDGKGAESALRRLYGVQAIPFTVLIGRDGKIAALGAYGSALEPAIRAALDKK